MQDCERRELPWNMPHTCRATREFHKTVLRDAGVDHDTPEFSFNASRCWLDRSKQRFDLNSSGE